MPDEQALDAEFCVIGALVVDASVHGLIASRVSPEDFETPLLRTLYSRITDMLQAGETVDPVSIMARVADMGDKAEMRRYLANLMQCSSAASIVEHHADLVQKNARLRRIREVIADKHIHGVLDPDAEIEDIIGKLHDIGRGRDGKGKSMTALMTEFAAWYGHDGDEPIIHTGHRRLDAIVGGLRPGQLVLLAARPSVGKSAFAGNLALDAAKVGIPSAIFSCEMSGLELMKRFVARESGEDLYDIDRRKLHGAGVVGALTALPLAIYDQPGVSVADIRLACKRHKQLGLVVIDYLQLLRTVGQGENRNLEVAAMTRELKMLARELSAPIVLLSQLNRAKDETQEPCLSDFRDSGAIEQDADVCIFLWRLEIRENNAVQKVGVKVGKNRSGRIGTVVMDFHGATMRHEETSEKYKPTRRGARYELPDVEGVG